MHKTTSSALFTRREALRFMGLAGGAAWLGAAGLRGADGVAGQGAGSATAAASLGGAQAGYYRFKIGEFEALALQDGGFSPPVEQSPFGVGEAPGEVAKVLDAALLPTARVDLPFNVLLVRTKTELVLVDSGCGAFFGAAGGRLLASMAAAGVKPEQVTGVILTHAHGDHFGGLLDAATGRPVFANAAHFVGRREHAFWMGDAPDLSGAAVPAETRASFVAGARAALEGLKDRWQLVEAGDRLLDGIELLDTPGHTPGHLAVVFGSGGEQLLHFADVAHHHAITFARPEWRCAFDADAAVAARTRRKLFDRAAADRLRMFGAHMPFPALGRVRRAGEGYDYVQEPFILG